MSKYKIEMNYYNGGYDTFYPQANLDYESGTYTGTGRNRFTFYTKLYPLIIIIGANNIDSFTIGSYSITNVINGVFFNNKKESYHMNYITNGTGLDANKIFNIKTLSYNSGDKNVTISNSDLIYKGEKVADDIIYYNINGLTYNYINIGHHIY